MRHIENYYRHLERLKRETKNERGLSPAFLQLLQNYADEVGAVVVAEESLKNGLRPDGTVKNSLHLPIGYWEAKDPKDDLSEEIQKKLKIGYPTKNIIFENTEEIVLFQNGKVVFDIKLSEKEKLHQLLETFFNFEPPEIENFHKALGKFAEDVPSILKVIRKKIDNEKSEQFLKIFSEFHNLCKIHISEKIEKSDIVEMLIQHILTKDIFMKIFHDVDFHQENAISKTMNKLETALLGRKGRQNLLKPIEYYYSAIRRVFQNIDELEKKKQFLIRVYEEFYKAYNPKGADKLGIVYTPLEIVTFMVHSVDKLLYKHFGKTLASENVNILDPATGTGTFMSEIINFLPKRDLKRKFNSELFANEIAILPYYIANLSIEYSYFEKTGEYLKFENIVFGDTLKMYQNEIRKRATKQMSFFDDEDFKENSERIERENETDFTVIIGNPPYNANQQNENDNNKNEVYPALDKRIKVTYVKNSSAQKTKVYDMYSRFYRWATDRIEKSGIVAFVTNSSFIDSKTFDGFRKTVFEEFTEIYVLDLGGNVRKGERDGNVFDIMVGVAIFIGIKRDSKDKCKLWYLRVPENGKFEKLRWLKRNRDFINDLDWEMIIPDKRGNWLNQTNNDWDELLPMGTKECKLGKSENAIFRLFSNGVVTARDDWVYDFDRENLEKKIKYHISEYEKFRKNWNGEDINEFVHSENSIKWTRHLKNQLKKGKKLEFSEDKIYKSLYRPFVKKELYFDFYLNEMQYQQPQIFPKNDSENVVINLNASSNSDFFPILGSLQIVDFAFLKMGNGGTQSFPLHTYTEKTKTENITDFALSKFQKYYKNPNITKTDIFNYIYAVLHFPEYRKKYEINLKQDLPRIPFYTDFYKFANIGKKLLELHTNFENVEEYPIKFPENCIFGKKKFLELFPKKALEYKLGNRSAIEWVIDGYKEKKIRDENVRQHFGKYHFPKDEVLSLLKKVTTVSLETLKLIDELK